MPAATDLIRRSLLAVGAIGSGENLSASQGADGLAELNSMLRSWSAQRRMVYVLAETGFSISIGTQTIGLGGTNPPARVVDSYVRDAAGYDYPVRLISQEQWNMIYDKDLRSSYPRVMKYELSTGSSGTISIWPVPDQALTFRAQYYRQLQSFATLSEDLSLPWGYEDAIVYSLALRLAPQYGRVPSADVRALAEVSTTTLMVNNDPVDIAVPDVLRRSSRYDINSDQIFE